ncbi:Avirulence (Avh) protein [Phytophthora megakarya]|uniref:RxLR effector protein n=1 Tax=Phytophthora megakarya TaxID=4795 RepID=A0A225VXA1_9STRA|nr:Avirulence (Avh) protein [Phytophthora megakarya]
MRLTYTIASVVVVTLFASSAAFPVTKDSTGMIDKATSTGIVDSIYMHDKRLLRRVEKSNVGDDDMGEERGFGDLVSKLNPVKASKKTAVKAQKAKDALKDAANYQKMLEEAKKLIRLD